MACPPGMVLNPRTLRCVRAGGRVARDLVRYGNIGELDVGYAAAAAPAYRRRTVRAPRAEGLPAFGAFFAAARPQSKPAAAVLRRAPAIPELTGALPCPPGTTRNPQTRRCIKLAGRTYKKLAAPAPAPAPSTYRAAGRSDLVPSTYRAPAPSTYRAAGRSDLVPSTYRAPAPRTYRAPAPRRIERVTSESSAHLPVGSAAPAPIGDRSTILEWADLNCSNTRDPLTNTTFATAGLDTLQSLVRTHDGVCTLGPALHQHVQTAHRAGAVATLPSDPSTHMTLDDFKALRDIMRREDPGYKIPGRRRQPPPPTWQLYIASDRRSGPDYATIMYVDTTKGRMTPYGIEYPPESVRVDMGFIPVSVSPGAICSPKTLSELIAHLADLNKLLVPVAGGWKPVAGFPFKKSYWDTDRAARMSRLCHDLAKVLASPV